MAKKATTLHDNLGNELVPVTNASITYMDDGNSVQAEIEDLKLKTQYNKGHYTTEQELLTSYPNGIQNPQSRKGWYAIVGETDSVWIWDIEGNEWKDSGVSSGGVESVNGLDGEVILTGSNIDATATIDTTSTTKSINGHLNDIYSELENTVDLNSSQLITGTKVFTEVIGLANTSEGTIDQIKHINSNFLITSGTGQNLLNIDEGLEKISAFNRELAYEDEIQQIQGDYATKDELSQEIQNVTDMIPTKVSELTNDSNYATEQYVQQNGGKIDTISVNGVQQTITNKNVNVNIPTNNNQLTNGAGYQNAEQVNNLISNATDGMLTVNNYSTTLDNVYQQKGDYATVSQVNSKQDTLTSSQLQAVNSGANATNINQITTNSNNINTINSKIPTQASSTNQLADRDFVNSSLNSIVAFYITYNSNGNPFPTKSALTSATTFYSGGQVRVPTRNDYAIVLEDESEGNATTRYIYYNQWEYQYTVNETALTADQLSAINSGITSTLVGKISSNEQMINSLAEQVANDYVPETRTINNKPLSSNITLNASDVGALPSSTSYVSSIDGSSGAVNNVAKMTHTGPIDNNLLLIGIDPNNATTTNDIQHANQIYIKDLALKSEVPEFSDIATVGKFTYLRGTDWKGVLADKNNKLRATSFKDDGYNPYYGDDILARSSDLLTKIYPVGSIYMSVNDRSPASFLGGTWEKLPSGYALWTASSGAGETISAGLPNITGRFRFTVTGRSFMNVENAEGAFSGLEPQGCVVSTDGETSYNNTLINFNANDGATVKSIYGNSTTVQPPAYKVYAWKRIS